MSKSIFRILSIVLCAIFVLSGCAKVEPLTEADENKIAVYSAGIIGKFNRFQKRGVVPVVMGVDPEEEMDTETPDDDGGSDFPLDPFDVNAPTSEGGESELAGIVGIPGVSITYKETNISQDYGADGGFVITPQNGNSFVSVTFTAANTTGQDIACNIRGKSLNFTANLGEVTSAVDRTILPDDLTTYNGTIAAGGSEDLSLLFQFPTSLVSDLSSLEIACVKDGVRYQVPF